MTYIDEIKETVTQNLPKEAMVSNVELEGPEIAIYTKNPKVFFENENFVAKIAFDLKKRINVRTDKALLEAEEVALRKIKEIVPEEADIRDISFNPAFSEVVIEAIKPGVVIGKGGDTSLRAYRAYTPNCYYA